MTVKAVIFCRVHHQAMSKVLEELNKIQVIKKIFSLTGDYDILAEIEVETTEDLYEAFAKHIDQIEGIIDTNTHVIMKSFEK